VIDLVQRLAAADEVAAARPVATPRDRALLGWERVCDQVAAGCQDGRAAAAVRAQLPYANPEPIALIHALADELHALAEREHVPPLAVVSAALTLLEAPPPRRLEGADLVAVARLAEDLEQLRLWLLDHEPEAPTWSAAARQMPQLAALASDLRRCLDRDGQLLDGASPLLGRLRRTARDREQQVRRSVAAAMSQATSRGWTTASEVTIRGDRFCLPLRAADRRKLSGIVHDRSQTGQTVYVEPAETVDLANDLAETRLEMAAEETRILLELNQRVDARAADLQAAAALMLRVDRVRAGLRWSEAHRAFRPQLAPGAQLRVCRARHPLLEAALAGGRDASRESGAERPVVPLDLELPPATRVVVISGPNAGGKSVAMKTVGVLVMLAQCGWDVPAREDTRLPLVRRLFVDLGDEQSIEDSLSSFSAHLTHLRRFLDEADEHSLLLCDEIGSGTDPQEGTALALTVLGRMADRGALVVASTHYGLLKAAVADHPRMLNAAMDYDERSLAPLFTLRLGDPGASHAFDIAERVGLDRQLLDEARGLVGEERYQLEQLLADLARRARELTDRERELQERLDAARRRDEELRERLGGLRAEIKREREAVARRADDLVRQARRDLEEAIRSVRDSGGDKVVIHKARRRVQEVRDELPDASPREAAGAPPDLQTGDRVRVPHLGLVGRVHELRGDKVGVLADGLRLSVDRDAVERIERAADASVAPSQPGPPAGAGGPGVAAETRVTAGAWTWSQDDPGIPPELDLRGLRADEAWERVDRLIDRAVPVGLDQLTIVHGVGPGGLREKLLDRLRGDDRVASTHPGGERQNNFGATVIHLA
jgi:DNA mismatch repair protein MutS2